MSLPRGTLRPMRIHLVSSVVVVAVAGALTIALTAGGDGGAEVEPPQQEERPAVAASPVGDGLVEFVSEEHGFALGYPQGWEVLDSPDEQVLLVATANGRDSMLVRVAPSEVTVETVEDLPAAREITDQLVGGAGVEVVVGAQPIELAGLPGYYYLYRFLDEASGETGAHSHYFVFDGDTMIVIVLQALPIDGFDELAPVFDEIVMSFRTL